MAVNSQSTPKLIDNLWNLPIMSKTSLIRSNQNWIRNCKSIFYGWNAPTACLIIISKLFEWICRLKFKLKVYLILRHSVDIRAFKHDRTCKVLVFLIMFLAHRGNLIRGGIEWAPCVLRFWGFWRTVAMASPRLMFSEPVHFLVIFLLVPRVTVWLYSWTRSGVISSLVRGGPRGRRI